MGSGDRAANCGYGLPVSLDVGGVEYRIRSDFRAVLDVLAAVSDPGLDEQEKASVMLRIIYPDWRAIPPELVGEALDAACGFIDCGCAGAGDGRRRPQLFDWEGDAAIIIPAVNGVAHAEVRALPYLHWWTFWGYFLEIGDSLFSTVLGIRHKRALHKKLDAWEEGFYRENPGLVDGVRRDDAEKMEEVLRWLDASDEQHPPEAEKNGGAQSV